MRPSPNTIEVVKIFWRDASIKGTRCGWENCAYQLVGIQVFLYDPLGKQSADYSYIRDMADEAMDMMEETK